MPVTLTGGIGINETPSGVIDGVNAIFTIIMQPNPAVIQLFHGVGATGVGNLLLNGVHYNLSGQTITYVGAYIPAAGDWHRCWYPF